MKSIAILEGLEMRRARDGGCLALCKVDQQGTLEEFICISTLKAEFGIAIDFHQPYDVYLYDAPVPGAHKITFVKSEEYPDHTFLYGLWWRSKEGYVHIMYPALQVFLKPIIQKDVLENGELFMHMGHETRLKSYYFRVLKQAM